MSDKLNDFDKLLVPGAPIAIVIKQYLRPVDGDGEPIFPPSYLMPTYNGRVHTIRDGEYRVSVELPAFRPGGKTEERSGDVAGYNIDIFPDGSNVCEIDSAQSQANRIEPMFEKVKGGKLVPQIEIRVGNSGRTVNLLDAGHRAADAIVRMSSLVDRFHKAFSEVGRGNHLELARLAPTSIVFGVWDSRGTQVKLPRIVKAEIRATNVLPLTRSAVFQPAVPYVDTGAVDANHEADTLSNEGMKHALASKTLGGVKANGEIKRVVRINLIAIRDLQAHKDGTPESELTKRLQRYVLGIALVAASQPLELNLREGCLLCMAKKEPSFKLVLRNGDEDDYPIDSRQAEDYAETTAKEFFGDTYETKDVLDATFESGVANEYLAMKARDREKVARNGPITAEAIRRFKEKGKDPLKLVYEAVKGAHKVAKEQIQEAKKTDPAYRGKNKVPVVIPDAFKAVVEKLDELAEDEEAEAAVKAFIETLRVLIGADEDTGATFKALDAKIKAFNKQRTEGEPEAALTSADDVQQA